MFKSHVKLSVLRKLTNESMSGYDIMRYLAGFGEKPSPGYIYPLLSGMEKQGFIVSRKEKRRKLYSITAKGRRLLDSLEKKMREMIAKMAEILGSLAEGEELREIRKTRDILLKGSMQTEDRMILGKFFRLLLVLSKDDDAKQGLRLILKDAVKKMESL